MPMINLTNIRFVTLYTGDNGPNECVCHCPCCSQTDWEHCRYQGTEEQCVTLLTKLPSLEQLYILGNPDPACDPLFCNFVAKEACKRNIHVAFSTSGAGGQYAMSKLLAGIPKEMIDYISFSIDSINKDKMSILKGINYPLENTVKCIEELIHEGYKVKIQPTLWSINFEEVEEIINFFACKGVSWFTFHVGSLESGINLETHQHLNERQMQQVYKQIEMAYSKNKNIKVRCPIIFPSCGNNDTSKWYCMNPERCKELLIYFKREGIMCTHSPMASNILPGLVFDITKIPEVALVEKCKTCPISKVLSGTKENLCRYVSKFWG